MKRKRLWLIVFAASLVLSVAGDFLFHTGEGEGKFWWSHVPCFFALLGFVGCIALIAIAKFLSHYWLEKKEDYYGEYDHSK